MTLEEAIARGMHVNRTLRCKGLTWDEIEQFWKECIEKTKETFNNK